MEPGMDLLDPLFREITDGVCVSDDQGRILYMNPAALALLNIDEADSRRVTVCDALCGRLLRTDGTPFSAQCPLREEDNPQKAVTFLGQFGPRTSFEWRDSRIQRFDQWKHLRVRCMRIPTPLLEQGQGGRHFLFIEDSSSEVELAKRKEDWRSMIAHDVRAPLSIVIGALANLSEAPPGRALDARQARELAMSLKASERMMELLDLYLEIARLDSGSMPVRFQRVEVLKLLRSCLEEQAPAALARRIEIGVEVSPALAVRADPDLLFRVFQNILNNALKYTPEGGRVTVSAEEDDESAAVIFKDTGPGIAREDLALIFDRFYQARARREGRLKGNGLGLTFCREALKAMKGAIDVESAPGAGSEFSVRLPRLKAEAP